MPTSIRRPPSYRRHQTGQAFAQFRKRRYYLGRYGSPESRERYDRFVAEFWVRRVPGPLVEVGPVSEFLVVQLAAAYWRFAQGYYRKGESPTSQLGIIRRALGLLRTFYAHLPAAKLGPQPLRAIQNHLIAANKSRSTINHLCAAIKAMFKWGVVEEIVPPSVLEGLRAVPGLRKGRSQAREPEAVGPVPDSVVEATLPFLPPVVADMVRFERLVGCRPGELLSMRPCDIDRTTNPWLYRPVSHKTEHYGRDRLIFVGPRAQEVLQPYLLRPAEAHCFSPAESEAKRRAEMRERRRTPVTPSQVNRREPRPKRRPQGFYTKDAYCRAIHRAVDRANCDRQGRGEDLLPHWRPNQLRHSAATEIRRTYGLEAAQVALGHARADVTQIYAERDATLAREIARKTG